MKKALAILATVATVGTTAMTAPAEARGRGFFGPGLAFGLAAGALTAGAIACRRQLEKSRFAPVRNVTRLGAG